ncbi:entry exclusion protein TrbK [Hoeflea sp.]|uniref:entry exclusion protein TrbK n=1 Tax=Hoeflea sp. TaxID=1940281 RepID=UPI00199F5A4E|nr:entry exclusion protein TrbK [Hoeflea sp.]MBC7282105.1 entry exclusion protein TrbK [Hoeflea sp.]
MSRTFAIAIGLLVTAASVSAATVFITMPKEQSAPEMSEEQRLAREKLFGSEKALPPIEKGQEMRPRW